MLGISLGVQLAPQVISVGGAGGGVDNLLISVGNSLLVSGTDVLLLA